MVLSNTSYYDRNYRPTAALLRARKPYLIPNIIGGISVFAFVIGVYTYTIHAVSQDDFSDVPMPEPPTRPAHTPNTSVVKAVSQDAVARRD